MTETQSQPGRFAYAGISKVHFYDGNIFPGFVPFLQGILIKRACTARGEGRTESNFCHYRMGRQCAVNKIYLEICHYNFLTIKKMSPYLLKTKIDFAILFSDKGHYRE